MGRRGRFDHPCRGGRPDDRLERHITPAISCRLCSGGEQRASLQARWCTKERWVCFRFCREDDTVEFAKDSAVGAALKLEKILRGLCGFVVRKGRWDTLPLFDFLLTGEEPGAKTNGVSTIIRTTSSFLGPLPFPVNSFFSSSCGCPTFGF